MKVGRYHYAAQFPDGIGPLMDRLREMILGGRYILTPELEAFEAEFAAHNCTRFAKGVNSGTDALAIAFVALGIRQGDEIVTHANAFNATVNAILLAGATPVLVDAHPATYLMQSADLDSAMSVRTRAVVPVHLYGKPTSMAPILQWAEKYGVIIVEDAAQAHGARIDGRRVGTFGAAGCYSFHPSKNLAAAGDGGAIVTDNSATAAAIEEIRALGQRGQNNHVRPGRNSKLDAIQAQILRVKLQYLDQWNRRRREVAAVYRNSLSDLPLQFQETSSDEEHAYHLFQVRSSKRDELLKHLVAAGIDAVVRYPTPIHLQAAFASFGWKVGQFPVAEALSRELLCLPIRPDLTESETSYICDTIRAFFK